MKALTAAEETELRKQQLAYKHALDRLLEAGEFERQAAEAREAARRRDEQRQLEEAHAHSARQEQYANARREAAESEARRPEESDPTRGRPE